MNDDSTLPQNKIIASEQLYSKAVSLILASAQRELLIFDQDLSRGDFCSLYNSNLLQQFFTKTPTSHLTIILQDTNFVKEKCPRLINLLSIFGHKMSIYETNLSAKHIKDCFVIADAQHYINRIHINQARFKYGLSDTENIGIFKLRFQELLGMTKDMITITKLGL
ncbi:hypothetical protein GALL_112210 [mine drainage metagenome]|uniref:DUF7931 domain-containing protein n=1 Tax=mine drainage metagenome TaxID=410659 RepID=A0A1J5T363_9ZZZZ